MVIRLVTGEQLETLHAVAERLNSRGLGDESRILREILDQLEQDVEARLERGPSEVSASIAARILEVTPQTIRNWVRSGILAGRLNRTGRFYVSFDALEPALRMREILPDQPAGAISDEAIDDEIDAARVERQAQNTDRR
jgi:hypothetical protein